MDDGLYTKIQALIDEGNLTEAEQLLDGTEEKDARWHYLSSHVYLAKNWTNESRKQLEIAIELDPENQSYKEELEALKESAEETLGKAEKQRKKKQLGKEFFDGCPELCCECCAAGGVEICCSAICDGCSG